MENVRVSTTRFIGTSGLTQIVKGSKLNRYLEIYARNGLPAIAIGEPELDHLRFIQLDASYQPNNAFNADIHLWGSGAEVLVIMDSCGDTFITFDGIPLFDEAGNQLYLEGYACNVKGSKPQPLTPPVFE